MRPAPVVGRAAAWEVPGGRPPEIPGRLRAGESLGQSLRLPPGTWEVSLRYSSDVPLEVRLGSSVQALPAYLDDVSSFVAVGRVSSRGGPLPVIVTAAGRRRLDVVRVSTLGSLAATRVDQRGGLVPLAKACGRYVDWYRRELARGPR